MIEIHVDNLIIIGSSFTKIKSLIQALNNRFHMSNLRSCKYYLDLTVICKKKDQVMRSIKRAYLKSILPDLKMTDCNPTPT